MKEIVIIRDNTMSTETDWQEGDDSTEGFMTLAQQIKQVVHHSFVDFVPAASSWTHAEVSLSKTLKA